jgi:hypothetical protein
VTGEKDIRIDIEEEEKVMIWKRVKMMQRMKRRN